MIPAIADFLPNSMIEWEDRLAALVVLQGCNYRCPFCHSAKFVPPGAPERSFPWDDVKDRLLEDRDWLDGVVISGGEPTIHAGLAELIKELRELRLPVKLDTNGSAPDHVQRLIDAALLDHIALDVKSPLTDEAHDAASQKPGALALVRRSLEILKKRPVSYELRTTVCPAVFPDDASLLGLARELQWAELWYLQSFRPVGCLDPALEKLPPTNPTWLMEIAERCREIAPGCRVRGSSV